MRIEVIFTGKLARSCKMPGVRSVRPMPGSAPSFCGENMSALQSRQSGRPSPGTFHLRRLLDLHGARQDDPVHRRQSCELMQRMLLQTVSGALRSSRVHPRYGRAECDGVLFVLQNFKAARRVARVGVLQADVCGVTRSIVELCHNGSECNPHQS